MATSIVEKEPQASQGASTVSSESAKLTVTGLDENGQMFREAAPIQYLNGRDCSFRSKFQPGVGSWMLIEIDLSKQGAKRSTLQGQVRSVQAEGVATNLFQVRVELESPQEVRIDSGSSRTQAPALESSSGPALVVTNQPIGHTNGAPTTSADPIDKGIKSEIPVPAKIKQVATIPSADGERTTPTQPLAVAAFSPDSAKSAIASEVKQQLAGLRASFCQELEQIVQRTVASNVEQLVRQAIEKQISVSYQSAIQALNSDLTYQLVTRLAGSEELRASVEKMAKAIVVEQVGSSKNEMVEAQQNLNSRAAEITRTLDVSADDLEKRLEVARESVAAVLERVQVLENQAAEGTLSLQKTVDQLNQVARSTIERFDGHVTAQLNSWSAQFKKHLDDVSKEKSGQFATDLQQQLAPATQNANDIVEKLSAGLQLAQGTLRMQEEQLAGLSRAAAAEVEKEIKAALLRLAGTV